MLFRSQTRVKVVKNKVSPPFRVIDFDIMYGQGISKVGELIDLGTKFELIDKSGSWFSYKGEKIGQGREKVKQYFLENPQIADELEKLIKQKSLSTDQNYIRGDDMMSDTDDVEERELEDHMA